MKKASKRQKMTKTPSQPRITFAKEDLRVLTDLEIQGVQGGNSGGTCVGCDTRAHGCSGPA